jgi:hypothetical protein
MLVASFSLRAIDFTGCKALFQQHVKRNDYFPSLEDFESYAREWLGVLQRAAEQNKGVIVLILDEDITYQQRQNTALHTDTLRLHSCRAPAFGRG